MKSLILACVGATVLLTGCMKNVKTLGGSSPPGVTRIDCGPPPPNNEWLTVTSLGEAHLYTVDIDKAPKTDDDHPEICLSVLHGDEVIWTHSPGRAKLGFPKASAKTHGCKNDPFKGHLPGNKEYRDMHHSAELNEKRVGCHYDLSFERDHGPSTDPHIVIGGK